MPEIILDSSMVEHSAVNRVVVGSSPTRGVLKSPVSIGACRTFSHHLLRRWHRGDRLLSKEGYREPFFFKAGRCQDDKTAVNVNIRKMRNLKETTLSSIMSANVVHTFRLQESGWYERRGYGTWQQMSAVSLKQGRSIWRQRTNPRF